MGREQVKKEQGTSHEPTTARKVEKTGLFAKRSLLGNRLEQRCPLPTSAMGKTRVKFRAAADTPNTHNKEGKSSQREHLKGRHQTIILPCVGANLSNGHDGTRVSSGYTARDGDRVGVSQVHGHNQALSSVLRAFHEPERRAPSRLVGGDSLSTGRGGARRSHRLVHGPKVHPILEVAASHEPERRPPGTARGKWSPSSRTGGRRSIRLVHGPKVRSWAVGALHEPQEGR